MRFLLFFVLLILPLKLVAEPVNLYLLNKPTPCGDFGEIIAAVTGKRWQETPIWRGGPPNEQGNQTVLFFNRSRTTWTLVEYRGSLGCVLGSGETSQLSDQLLFK